MKRLGQIVLVGTLLLTLVASAIAQKVRFGTDVKLFPPSYMPVMVAEEKGMWKQNGLEVEWFPFVSSVPLMRAVAARSVDVGINQSVNLVPSIVAGVPAIVISHVSTIGNDFRLWVRADSPIREPKQLKGARVGVLTLGSASHGYARIIAGAEEVGKDVRYVGTGGSVENVAALKAGAVDAVVQSLSPLAELYVTGQVRQIVSAANYLPREWVASVVLSRSDFAKSNPEVVKRVLRALLQAGDFIVKNPQWSIEKMKSVSNYSDKAAKLFYDEVMQYTRLGKVERKGLENLINFLTNYGIIPKEKAPSIDALYTEEFLP